MKHILLYGDSIFLSGLAAQLQEQDDLDVIQQTSHAGPLSLDNLDAIIVDFNDVGADDVLAIMRARPDLKIVGINAPGGAVTVFSGKVYLAHTLADVVGCLEQ
jgi:hypothetical protein